MKEKRLKEMEKYNALIKGWKHLIKYDKDEKVQFVIFNRGYPYPILSLLGIGLYNPLTKDEWLEFGISDDNAVFYTAEELEFIFDYLEEC